MPLEAYLSKSVLERGACSGGRLGIRCLLICVKKIDKVLLITQNIFQRVIYEIILITHYVLINDQNPSQCQHRCHSPNIHSPTFRAVPHLLSRRYQAQKGRFGLADKFYFLC